MISIILYYIIKLNIKLYNLCGAYIAIDKALYPDYCPKNCPPETVNDMDCNFYRCCKNDEIENISIIEKI